MPRAMSRNSTRASRAWRCAVSTSSRAPAGSYGTPAPMLELFLGLPERHRERRQLSLRAIVQVALRPGEAWSPHRRRPEHEPASSCRTRSSARVAPSRLRMRRRCDPGDAADDPGRQQKQHQPDDHEQQSSRPGVDVEAVAVVDGQLVRQRARGVTVAAAGRGCRCRGSVRLQTAPGPESCHHSGYVSQSQTGEADQQRRRTSPPSRPGTSVPGRAGARQATGSRSADLKPAQQTSAAFERRGGLTSSSRSPRASSRSSAPKPRTT